MDFKPSQFVYVVVRAQGITTEPHPYSIANGYNLDGQIKLGVKEAGDHTASLRDLARGDEVTLYGPYGHFSDAFLRADRDCVFIGGGIGITPFIGMWHVALHSEERYEGGWATEPMLMEHPELFINWKAPRVALYYVCRYQHQASFDADVRREAILSQFHGLRAVETRGHHYERYLSAERGRFTVEHIEATSGDYRDKYIFLCGPSPMVTGLVQNFLAAGVSHEQIIVEDFNLL